MQYQSKSLYYRYQPDLLGFVSYIAGKVRRQMFRSILEIVHLTECSRVLDVGVTSDRRPESNFFEKWYPYPQNITAVGMEDLSCTKNELRGVNFVNAHGLNLPFDDETFDLGVSFAVIEHAGCRDSQKRFVSELCRVSKVCCVETPNRWYPIEFHTCIPLLHWLPAKYFRKALKSMGNEFYSKKKNLNLLSETELLGLFPDGAYPFVKHFRLLGLVSNLMAFCGHTK